jgi:hypothetical protein
MGILGPREVTTLTTAYKVYRFKGKLQKRAVETIFKTATGKHLGPKYYAIPIVQKLIELT